MGNALWRNHGADFKWTDKYSRKLVGSVAEIKPTSVRYKPVIMMFGPIGHGKSCFINSIDTINKRRTSNIATAANHGSHTTSVFRKYEMKEGILSNVILADVQGVDRSNENAFLVKNILAIIDGHVKPEYEFDRAEVVSEGHDFYNANPMDYDKVHCVMFVFDCRYVDRLDRNYAASIMTLMRELFRRGIPRVVILTQADRVCGSGIENVFCDKIVKQKVDYIRDYLGVPLENIHPVQNYGETSGSTTNLNKLMHIPLLLALQQALYFACDTIESLNNNSASN